jgi:rhamnosyltransferase
MHGAGEPLVSLFVPTYNAGPEFPSILERMLAQELDRPFEVVVIDSSSTDGTFEFLERQPVRLSRIPKAEFDHGLTRNRGIELAHGAIVVLATQDARPADAAWMQHLVDCFEDPRVAGAFSRQLPRPDANPIIRDRLGSWVAGTLERRVQEVASEAEFQALAPLERLQRVAFDNVSSAVRKSAMAAVPFLRRKFGEDIDWARRAILAGWRLVYEPRSCVVHSHNHSAWYELKRIYGDHYNLHDSLGVHTVATRDALWECARARSRHYREVVARDERLSPLARFVWSAKAPAYGYAENLGQFLGGRAARKLAEGSRVYRWLDRVLRRGV